MKRKIKTDGTVVPRRRRPLSLSRTVLPFARCSRAFARGRRQCWREQRGQCSRSALGDARSRFARRFAATSSGRGRHRACAEDRARARAKANGGTRCWNLDLRTNRTDESRVGFFGRGIPGIDSPLRNYSKLAETGTH